MKYIKDINENFKLVDLSNSQWFGSKPTEDYVKNVTDYCLIIEMEELQVDEKSFAMIDRLIEINKKAFIERKQELDAIVHNCKQRNMRPKYTAEVVYHTILQGRLSALLDRSFVMGGLKPEET